MAADGTPTTLPGSAPGPALLPRARAIVDRHLHAGRRAAWGQAFAALLLTRALIWVAGLVGVAAVGEAPGAAAAFDPEGLTTPFGPVADALVAPLARWDAVWFLDVAAGGYGADVAKPAFFPLYPALAKAAGLLTGSALVGGVLVSLVALAGALYLLHRLTALELGAPAAASAVWLTALFPTAFCFSAVYSEALFLLLSVGCLYAARTDRWAWAGVLGLLAAATRSAGLVLVVPLLVLLWQQRSAGERVGARAGWVVLVPLGTAAFSAWLALHGVSARAPFDAQAVWFRELSWPFAAVWDGSVAAVQGVRQLLAGTTDRVFFAPAGGDPVEVAWTNLGLWAFLLVGLVATVGVVRRLPPAYGAYVVAALALPLSTPPAAQPLMSLPRFLVVLFPLAMWGGWWLARRGPATRVVVLGASTVALVLLTARFASWRWVA